MGFSKSLVSLILVFVCSSVFVSCSSKKTEKAPESYQPAKNPDSGTPPAGPGNKDPQPPVTKPDVPTNPPTDGPVIPPVKPPVTEPTEPPTPTDPIYRMTCEGNSGVQTFTSRTPDGQDAAFVRLFDQTTADQEHREVDELIDRLYTYASQFVAAERSHGTLIFEARKSSDSMTTPLRFYISDVDLLYNRGKAYLISSLPWSSGDKSSELTSLGLPALSFGLFTPEYFLARESATSYAVMTKTAKKVMSLSTGQIAYNPRVLAEKYLVFDGITSNGVRPLVFKFAKSGSGFKFEKIRIPFDSTNSYALQLLGDSTWVWLSGGSSRQDQLVLWNSRSEKSKRVAFEKNYVVPPHLQIVTFGSEPAVVVGVEKVVKISSNRVKVEVAEFRWINASGDLVKTEPYPVPIVKFVEGYRGDYKEPWMYRGGSSLGGEDFFGSFITFYQNSPFLFEKGSWRKVTAGGCRGPIGAIREN